MPRPDREDTDEGSEIEDSESEDTRVASYLNGGMEEVSDPEMWMNLHYLSPDSEIDNEEEQPSVNRTLIVGDWFAILMH